MEKHMKCLHIRVAYMMLNDSCAGHVTEIEVARPYSGPRHVGVVCVLWKAPFTHVVGAAKAIAADNTQQHNQ